jgi:hypothetical protein
VNVLNLAHALRFRDLGIAFQIDFFHVMANHPNFVNHPCCLVYYFDTKKERGDVFYRLFPSLGFHVRALDGDFARGIDINGIGISRVELAANNRLGQCRFDFVLNEPFNRTGTINWRVSVLKDVIF